MRREITLGMGSTRKADLRRQFPGAQTQQLERGFQHNAVYTQIYQVRGNIQNISETSLTEHKLRATVHR